MKKPFMTRLSAAHVVAAVIAFAPAIGSVERAHAVVMSTQIDTAQFFSGIGSGGTQYDTASSTIFVDPVATNWIALSRSSTLVDASTGANNSIAPNGVLDILNMNLDDFVVLTVSLGAASTTATLDQNGSLNERVGVQSVIFGSHPSVWAVTSINFSTSPAITNSATFAETGALTSFFNTNGAGNYLFSLSYRNQFTGAAGHGPVFLLMDVDPPSEVPLPAALPLFAGGLALLGLLGWRRRQSASASV